jgi:hypothetical protein
LNLELLNRRKPALKRRFLLYVRLLNQEVASVRPGWRGAPKIIPKDGKTKGGDCLYG